MRKDGSWTFYEYLSVFVIENYYFTGALDIKLQSLQGYFSIIATSPYIYRNTTY